MGLCEQDQPSVFHHRLAARWVAPSVQQASSITYWPLWEVVTLLKLSLKVIIACANEGSTNHFSACPCSLAMGGAPQCARGIASGEKIV